MSRRRAGSNLEVALGGFNAPTSGTTGTTVTVSGLAFQLVFVFLWMSGRTETSDSAVLGTMRARASFGMFNASGQYTWGAAHANGSADSNSGEVHRNDCCIMRAGAEFGVDAATYRGMSLSSINSDGFTLAIDSHSTAAWAGQRIHYLALGGSDLNNSTVSSVTITSGTGNQSFTPLAYQPVALLFANMPITINTFLGPVTATIGAATGASDQWVWGGQADQNVGTTDTARYLRADECHASLDSAGGSLTSRARFVSLDASGFTVNRLEGAVNYATRYGALGGILAHAWDVHGEFGGWECDRRRVQAEGDPVLTHGTTQSTADTPQQDHTYSIGASVTGITQRCAHVHDIDNQATSTIAVGHRDDSVIMTTDTSAALDSQIAVSSHDSDGFTYSMPTSALSGYLVGYLALG